MSYVKTAPVVAKPVHFNVVLDEGLEALKANAGGFELLENEGGRVAMMRMICPCGCGRTAALAIRPAPSPSWEWDGNRDKPTLTPSVHHVGHWHGWLRAGVWESCRCASPA
jgi:uncharacterized protein DUF6527